jgi:uncharacterized membrane protein YkoI
MKSQYCWWIFVVLLSMSQAKATVYNNDPYSLPPTKSYLDSCQKKALQLHQGKIEKQSLLHRDNSFMLQYEIYANDGTRWLVSCNLGTGEIIDESNR